MKTTNEAQTVEELNAIQAEWMALQNDASDAEKKRVFKLMDGYPRRYISTNAKGGGILMIDGAPMFAAPVLMTYAVQVARKHGARVDIVWDSTNGQWAAMDLTGGGL